MFTKPFSLLFFIILFRWKNKLLLVFLAFLVALLGIVAPLLQKIFVDQLTHQSAVIQYLSIPPHLSNWIWLLGGGVALLLSLSLYQLLVYFSTQEAAHAQHAISQELYSHLLKLRPLDYKNKTTGEFISIYATDIPSSTILIEQSLPQGLNIIFPLILTPAVLIQFFGVPALALLPVLIGFVLLNLGLAYRQSLFFYQFKSLAADRIGLVNEWLQNIKSLRIFGWISLFEKKIILARQNETKNRIRMLNNGQTMNALSSSMTFAMTVYIIWLMQKNGTAPTPGNLLAVFWLVSIFLTRSFRQLPWFFTFLFDAWTSIQRLSQVFQLGDDQISEVTKESSSEDSDESLPSGTLTVKNLNLNINNVKILDSVSFEIQPHEFVALIGPVGAGKSLLLLSLLGETNATFDDFKWGTIDLLKIPKKEWKNYFSFIPQDGFLISGTLRENLHFEYQPTKSKDSELLEYLPQVQLNFEQEGFSKGLDTLIGERGLNLSGGQKQRVSLARIFLQKRYVYLFDDCLSAIDVNTEINLLKILFNKPFSTCPKILVTSRFKTLNQFNKILFIQNGKLVDFNHFDALSNNPHFDSFIKKIEAPL